MGTMWLLWGMNILILLAEVQRVHILVNIWNILWSFQECNLLICDYKLLVTEDNPDCSRQMLT